MSREESTASPTADTSTYVDYLHSYTLTPDQINRLRFIKERRATQNEMILQCAIIDLRNMPGTLDTKIAELENLPLEMLKVLAKYKKSGLISGKTLQTLKFDLTEHKADTFIRLFPIAKSLPINDLILFVERLENREYERFLEYSEKQRASLILLLKMFQLSCCEAMDLQDKLSDEDIDFNKMVLMPSFFNNPKNKPTVLILVQKILIEPEYYAEIACDPDYLSIIAKKYHDLFTLHKIIENSNANLQALKYIAKNPDITIPMLEDLLSSSLLDAELAHFVLTHPKAIITHYVKDNDVIHKVCQTYEINVFQKFVDHFPSTTESIKNFLALASMRNEFFIIRDNIKKFKNAAGKIAMDYVETLATNPNTPWELLHDIVLASDVASEPLFEAILCHRKISYETFQLITDLVSKTYFETNTLFFVKTSIMIEIQKYITDRSSAEFKKKSPATTLKIQNAKELLHEISHISTAVETNMFLNQINAALNIAIATNKRNVRGSLWYSEGDYLKVLTKCKVICDMHDAKKSTPCDATPSI